MWRKYKMSDWQGSGTPSTTLTWADQFRVDLKEFADTVRFTDGMIGFWYGIGDRLMDATHFLTDTTVRNYMLELWVAHNVIMDYNNQIAVAAGNYTGEGLKPANSYSVGDVSISYDNSSFMEQNGGDWNATIYGRKLLRLIRNLCPAYQVY
jgi:hypothetical protein